MAKKTKAELEAELRFLRRRRNHDGWVSVLNNLIRWGGLVVIALFVYKGVEVLAGETTTADIGLRFLADIRVSYALSYVVGVGGAAYGLRQRALRKTTVERLHGRIEELERDIDPKRTTSGLTPRGGTHPADV